MGDRRFVKAGLGVAGGSDPRCRNSSNPCHECSDFCLQYILKSDSSTATALDNERERLSERPAATGGSREGDEHVFVPGPVSSGREHKEREVEVPGVKHKTREEEEAEAMKGLNPTESMTPAQRKLFELRLRMNDARRANHASVMAERRKKEEPDTESKKRQWEERQAHDEKVLAASGLDLSKRYMLHTAEQAEAQYKKKDKKGAPVGLAIHNRQSLFEAYDRRAAKLSMTAEEYDKLKESDPEFYREANSLAYGQAVAIPEDKIDKMVKELEDKAERAKNFSRRRRHHDDKDVDAINTRNEQFNKAIDRAFGKYTVEIKQNLERGTALPD